MRQNLTNVKEIDIKDVEHFYVVGSTTKEGLLEGKSNVKLDLKKAASGGGGTSSEDAERMYEALFGQTPYLVVALPDSSVDVVPLYEIFEGINSDAEITNHAFIYKSSTPVPKATVMESNDSADSIVFLRGMGIYMMEIPPMPEMPDTWYIPVAYDVSLVGYTTPTFGNPTTVSGTLPDKREIEVLVSDQYVSGENPTEAYYWDNVKDAFIKNIDQSTSYQLKQSGDNVIEWSYVDRES